MKLTLTLAAIILVLSFAAMPAQLVLAKPKVITNPYFRPFGPGQAEEQKAQQNRAGDEAGQQHDGDQRSGKPPKGQPRPSRN